jgi:hypothetical protein
MSILSALIASTAKSIENAEKASVVSAVKAQIITLLTASAPTTEAEAVTLVNKNITEITGQAVAAIKSPILSLIVTIEEPTVVSWVEGIADGLVSECFVYVVSQAAGTVAGAAEAAAQTEALPTINVAAAA